MPNRNMCAMVVAWLGLWVQAMLVTATVSAGDGVVLRIETEVFVDGDQSPAARSLTLFERGVTWDFLDPVTDDGANRIGEVILHDPARERVVVLDGQRGMKTEIRTIRLERLNVSLAKWARQSKDPLIRWSGGPDFGDALSVEDDRVALEGPKASYTVLFTTGHGAEAATAYRRFADTAILLRSLMHPGGLPPFPRLAINRRVEAGEGIPSEVTLQLSPKRGLIPTRHGTLKSVHKVHPQFIDEDRSRIDAAAARMGVADAVGLDEFVRRRDADQAGHSEP